MGRPDKEGACVGKVGDAFLFLRPIVQGGDVKFHFERAPEPGTRKKIRQIGSFLIKNKTKKKVSKRAGGGAKIRMRFNHVQRDDSVCGRTAEEVRPAKQKKREEITADMQKDISAERGFLQIRLTDR